MRPTNLERILREHGISEIDTRKIVETAKEHFPSFYELEIQVEGLEAEIEQLKAENAALSMARDQLGERVGFAVSEGRRQIQTEKEVTKKLQESYERLQQEKQSDLAGEVAFQKSRVNSLLSAVKILSDFL